MKLSYWARYSVAFVLVLAATSAIAQAPEEARLAHLKGVEQIAIDLFVDGLGKTGPTESQLRTDAELRLRMAHVDIVAPTTAPNLSLNRLVIDVFASAESADGPLHYRAEVYLLQPARSLTNDTIIMGKAWSTAKAGTLDRKNPREFRLIISDLIDKFLNDLLAASPPR